MEAQRQEHEAKLIQTGQELQEQFDRERLELERKRRETRKQTVFVKKHKSAFS